MCHGDQKKAKKVKRWLQSVVKCWHHDKDDNTASRPLSEVKHLLTLLVLRWGTTLESQVLYFLPLFVILLIFLIFILLVLFTSIHSIFRPSPAVSNISLYCKCLVVVAGLRCREGAVLCKFKQSCATILFPVIVLLLLKLVGLHCAYLVSLFYG